MTDTSKTLRPIVRDLMQAAPTRPFTLRALHRLIHAEDPSVTELDVDGAVTWHFGQGNLKRAFNHELEVDEYTLTERGLK